MPGQPLEVRVHGRLRLRARGQESLHEPLGQVQDLCAHVRAWWDPDEVGETVEINRDTLGHPFLSYPILFYPYLERRCDYGVGNEDRHHRRHGGGEQHLVEIQHQIHEYGCIDTASQRELEEDGGLHFG